MNQVPETEMGDERGDQDEDRSAVVGRLDADNLLENQNTLTPDQLEALITACQSGSDKPSGVDEHPEAAYVRELVATARDIKPDTSFSSRLRLQLSITDAPVRAGRSQRNAPYTAGCGMARAAQPACVTEQRAWLMAASLVAAALIAVSFTAWSAMDTRHDPLSTAPVRKIDFPAISMAPPPPDTATGLAQPWLTRPPASSGRQTTGVAADQTRPPAPRATALMILH